MEMDRNHPYWVGSDWRPLLHHTVPERPRLVFVLCLVQDRDRLFGSSSVTSTLTGQHERLMRVHTTVNISVYTTGKNHTERKKERETRENPFSLLLFSWFLEELKILDTCKILSFCCIENNKEDTQAGLTLEQQKWNVRFSSSKMYKPTLQWIPTADEMKMETTLSHTINIRVYWCVSSDLQYYISIIHMLDFPLFPCTEFVVQSVIQGFSHI